jgi:hypothetical protein
MAMPADYGESLRQVLRSREGELDDEKSKEMLKKLEDFRQKTHLQIPEIERTILKLTKQPKQLSLWARLLNRLAGWALGLSQARRCWCFWRCTCKSLHSGPAV